MDFVNWGLSYLFFTAGIIYIIYLLKKRKIKYNFSSVMLWEDLEAESSSRSQWSRFRPDLLFWLHILILALLVLSLMQPQLSGFEEQLQSKIIIVDDSASMQAEDVAPNRFNRSKEKMINFIDTLEGNFEIALISSVKSDIISDFSSSKEKFINKIEEMEVSDGKANTEKSIDLALSLAADKPNSEILFFTDGAFPDINYNNEIPLTLKSTGSGMGNIGITGLDIKPVTFQREEYQIMVKVSNFTSNSREVPVSLNQRDQLITTKNAQIAAGENEIIFFNITNPERTSLEIKLGIDDEFSVDNTGYLVMGNIEEKLEVLLISSSRNIFLEKALQTNNQINLTIREDTIGKESQQFDLVIYDNIFAPVIEGGNNVFIKDFPANYRENILNDSGSGKISEWEKGHTLFDMVDINQLQIEEYSQVKPPSSSRVIMSTENSPLILSKETTDWKWLYLAFRLQNSNLPLHPDFPIFIDNMMKWFFPQFFAPEKRLIKTGDTFSFRPGINTQPTGVVTPSGNEIDLLENESGYTVTKTYKNGIYQLAFGNNRQEEYFAVNLVDENESNLNPVEQNITINRSPVGTETKKDLWPYLLFGILIL